MPEEIEIMRKKRTAPKAIRFSKQELEEITECIDWLNSVGKETNLHRFVKTSVMERMRSITR